VPDGQVCGEPGQYPEVDPGGGGQPERGSLAGRVESESSGSAVDELREEVSSLRRQVGVLQTQLIDLYARVGQPYPREDAKPQPRSARRAVGE